MINLKNLIESVNIKFDQVEERISELENRLSEVILLEDKKIKIVKIMMKLID